jgi:hypothetical protein
VICYDDILLCNSTVTGLQHLINTANEYILKNGLRFNAKKTVCVINGKLPFTQTPKWYINESLLIIEDNFRYLGAYIGNDNNSVHVASRIRSCRQSFYSLQGSGLCHKGLKTQTSVHIWSATCKATLLYGCETMLLKKVHRDDLDKLQAKLIKSIVGIGPKYRSTPLLEALKVTKISRVIDVNNLFLLKRILCNKSGAALFYSKILSSNICMPSLLTSRVNRICNDHDIDFNRFLINDIYAHKVKSNMLKCPQDNENGLVDSIRLLLRQQTNEYNMNLLKFLLKAF